MIVRSMQGALTDSMYDPDVELLGRRRRRRRRRPRKLFRKLRARLKKRVARMSPRSKRRLRALKKISRGPFGPIAKRIKKRIGRRRRRRRALKAKLKGMPRGQRRKAMRKLIRRRFKRTIAGPFGMIAKRLKARRRRRKAARRGRVRRVARGARAIVPALQRRTMLREARRPFEPALPEERAMIAPGLELEPEEAITVRRKDMWPARPERAMVEEVDTEEREEAAPGRGIMQMIKRNPMLIAIPGGALLLLMLMPRRRGGSRARVSTKITQ